MQPPVRYAVWPLALVVGLWVLAGCSRPQPQLPDFTALVEKASPAVVNISTTQTETRRGPGALPPGMEDSPFGEFFRHFFGEEGEAPPHPYQTESLGSGFIISDDGYVLTNHHVVAEADEVIVKLSDRRQFTAKIVGSDPASDLSLLKIEADDLPTVRIGDVSQLKVGEWVLAIGSPFGFDHSVTAGIVSAKRRSLGSEQYVPFIQTDVAINPGNSGGPLFNLKGEVVGINSQIYSRTGGYMGLSFAIPIDVAMDVVRQLQKTGKVTRGWLGVVVQEVDRGLAKSFGMRYPEGALVADVLPGSPAQEAGIKIGDIIVEFNGESVPTANDLPPLVGSTPVGDKVTVKLLREGKQLTLKARIGQLPEGEAAAAGKPELRKQSLGLEVDDLTPEQRQAFNIPQGGVLVTDVQDGPAAAAGLQPGDVLIRLGNERLRDAAHFHALIAKLPPGSSVPVLVERQGQPLFLALETPD
ncbi:MAG TPA: DegQ family serine endoprotease [Nevskiales bacterium]|nr:DegQ family serine endoprotease [Nevskiales bacterium]